ncbi:MAG: hypothetical protein ABIQ36_08120 [Rhodanobacter sp.]
MVAHSAGIGIDDDDVVVLVRLGDLVQIVLPDLFVAVVRAGRPLHEPDQELIQRTSAAARFGTSSRGCGAAASQQDQAGGQIAQKHFPR